jgi:hypothetical protein
MSRYRERLTVPILWWLLLLGFVASVAFVFQHAYGPTVSLPVAGVVLVLGVVVLGRYGNVRIEVGPSGLRAGRAHLPIEAVGAVASCSGAEAVRARGPELSAHAYGLIRGYVDPVVTVRVADEDDPTPYWIMSTRHPERLMAALGMARQDADAGR